MFMTGNLGTDGALFILDLTTGNSAGTAEAGSMGDEAGKNDAVEVKQESTTSRGSGSWWQPAVFSN
jgi:hypothetical protein